MEALTIQAQFLFQFESEPNWINSAQRKYAPYAMYQTLAINSKGEVCAVGSDFMDATKNNLYPIKVYLVKTATNKF